MINRQRETEGFGERFGSALKRKQKASETAQQVKALATHTDNLSLSQVTSHGGGRELITASPHTHHAQTHTYKRTFKKMAWVSEERGGRSIQFTNSMPEG